MRTLKKLFFCILLVLVLFACKTHQPTVETQTSSIVASKVQSAIVNGVKLHYVEQGFGEPLIFIHGYLGDYKNWIQWVEEYSNNYDAVTYSRRYAYPNKKVFDHEADYSIRIHAEDLYALIQELGFKKVNLVGHSYGASTALAVTLDHPEVIESLILGEPPSVSLLEDSPEAMENFKEFENKYLQPAQKAFQDNENDKGLDIFYKAILGEDRFSINQVSEIWKQKRMENISEVWGTKTTELKIPVDKSKIQELQIPVLLLIGDRSPQWLREIGKEMNHLMPQSELVVIENSSHGLYFENPEACDKAIREFLEKN
jgi:pimeloyl-ACP methyl ester carboxylesterase